MAELILGTAQLGMTYGITNATGMPTLDESNQILKVALDNGVSCLDTAQAYGKSEQNIGHFLQNYHGKLPVVISKLAPSSEPRSIRQGILNSLSALKIPALDVFLLHRWDQFGSHAGQLWKELKLLKAEGIVRKLGVSISTPEELLKAISEPSIELIQFPFNLVDWRWNRKDVNSAIASRTNITFHVRSIYLQGLLIDTLDYWPIVPNFDSINLHQLIGNLAMEFGVSKQELCYGFVNSHAWIDGIVVGVASSSQLRENLRLREIQFSEDQLQYVRSTFDQLSPTEFLNPALWKEK